MEARYEEYPKGRKGQEKTNLSFSEVSFSRIIRPPRLSVILRNLENRLGRVRCSFENKLYPTKLLVILGLGFVKLGILTLVLDQILMGARLYNLSLLQDIDPINFFNR